MALYEKYPVTLSNSLGGKKEIFKPVNPGHIGMYVCGPTVYNDVHLGNVRTFLTFDIVSRYFRHLGYKVRYVRNITDVGHLENDADEGEDKIAKKARVEQLEPMEVVKHYTEGFHEVMRQFNILPPSIEPSATGHLVEQIEITKTLIDKGLAYEVNGSVYFDVMKYHNGNNNYGILSGRVIEDLIESGRKLDSQDEKRNKIDFALWKKASPYHIMRWPSPWSIGFPGWHIECTVMSTKYLGETFDIHGGGMDLKFPHHECEIAQAVGANGKQPVNYWLHSNMLTVNGQKMSKSLGNSFLPRQLFSGDHQLLEKGFGPMTVRFFMLQSHYSSTLDFSNEALNAAEKGFKKLSNALGTVKKLEYTGGSDNSELRDDLLKMVDACYSNMSDDFNTAKTLAALFEMSARINDFKSGNLSLKNVGEETFSTFKNAYIQIMEDVLGLREEEEHNHELLSGVINVLIDLRKKARVDKNYALSDKIRDDLKQLGVQLKDGKDGEINFTIE